MSDTGAKKNTSYTSNHAAFSKELERIYDTLAGDVGMDSKRDIFLGYGMLEWLSVFGVKQASPTVSSGAFRIKSFTDTSQDELVTLFANMIGGRNHGTLRA